jgi:hypothetical protein
MAVDTGTVAALRIVMLTGKVEVFAGATVLQVESIFSRWVLAIVEVFGRWVLTELAEFDLEGP